MAKKDKILISLAVFFLVLGVILISSAINLGSVRIIACNVGQGDATLVISPKGSEVLIDGGPGKKVLDCLSSKMPFWDRTIEAVVLTHPQKDHMEGLLSVLENYKVKLILTTGVQGEISQFGVWEEEIEKLKIKTHAPVAGEKLVLGDVSFDVLWPAGEKLSEWKRGEPIGDLNDSSVVLRLNSRDGFCGYFTGDIPVAIFEGVIDRKCQFLKVSHHGSKTGTSGLIVDRVEPKIAFIEVGKNNTYGHPSTQTLDLLKSKGTKIYRTDTDGMVELIESQGKLKVTKGN